MSRTRQTAEVLFPGARLVEVKDLQEMCFGSFEGKNYVEMEHDADYQAWVLVAQKVTGSAAKFHRA